jgi:hypothetical protein
MTPQAPTMGDDTERINADAVPPTDEITGELAGTWTPRRPPEIARACPACHAGPHQDCYPGCETRPHDPEAMLLADARATALRARS